MAVSPPPQPRAAHGPPRPPVQGKSAIRRMLDQEAAGSVLLLACALVALGLANSPLAGRYEALWSAARAVELGSVYCAPTLRFWVNDVIMVLFFFVVGLEIRREMAEGELSDARRAALPVVAALGGMFVPALVYFAVNRGLPSQHGWGIPMATDIAFAVGVLTLLGKRVPPALRVLLLALAVIDDVGAIVVIAVAYTSHVALGGVLLAGGAVLAAAGLVRLRARARSLYLACALAAWFGLHHAGIHPTLAGVALGLIVPMTMPAAAPGTRRAKTRHEVAILDPLLRALHPVVAFGVMPLFALANAGVSVQHAPLREAGTHILDGVVCGLLLGKPAGILAACTLATRTGLATLPRGVTLRGVLLVGMVASIGFTMAIFIATLAFDASEAQARAKLAVLIATGAAATLALTCGRFLLPAPEQLAASGAATSEEQAEASTDC